MMTRITLNSRIKTFIITVVSSSLVIWDLTFNLGAYGVVFFDKIFASWVTASATLLGCLLLPKSRSPVSNFGLVIMAFPTISFFFLLVKDTVISHPILPPFIIFMSFISYGFCLPYTIFVILYLTQKDLIQLPKQLLIRLVIIIIVIGSISYLVGRYNYFFLSCSDFKVSGNDLPSNCRPGKEGFL